MRCYCCSSKSFDECCEPFIKGDKHPSSAEQLMRSRFSAYATAHYQYILETYTKEKQQGLSVEDLAQSAPSAPSRPARLMRPAERLAIVAALARLAPLSPLVVIQPPILMDVAYPARTLLHCRWQQRRPNSSAAPAQNNSC